MTAFSRILVIVTQQLGDVLLCTPLVRACRERWPDARIDVLGFAGTLALLDGNPDVSATIEVSRRSGLLWHLGDVLRLWRRYDLALMTQAGDRAHLYGAVAAPTRSGLLPSAGNGRWWKRRLLQHGVDGDRHAHSVLEKLRLVSPWITLDQINATLVPPAPAALPPAMASIIRRPMVVVQVPSMWRYKQWPVAHYRHVVAGLLDDDVQVVLTGAKTAHDDALVAPLRGLAPEPRLIDACGRLSLAQVTALLGKADAYLGPDTSITHVAAAVGVPTVTVYGPTPPGNWGPWPGGSATAAPWVARAERQQVRRIVMLQGPDLPDRRCVPCGRMGCDDHHGSASHCLEHLAAQRVLDELQCLLSKRPST